MKEIYRLDKLKAFFSSLALWLDKAIRLLRKILTTSPAETAVIPENSLCISIGIDGISVCYGSKFLSRIRVKGFKNIYFTDDKYPEPEDFASAVFSAVKELKVKKAEITLGVPKAWTIIRPVEFPLAVKKELSNAVTFEIDRLTPFSPENALYDFIILSEKDNNIQLLLIAAKADLVNRYTQALAEKGMNVNRVTVNLSGISTLLTCMDKTSDFIFVQISKNAYEGGLIKNGLLASGFTGRIVKGEAVRQEENLIKEVHNLITSHSGQEKPLKIIADFVNGVEIIWEDKLSIPVQNLRNMDIKLHLAEKNLQDIKKLPFAAAGAMLESLRSKASKPDLLGKGIHKEPKTPFGLTVFLLLVIAAMGIFNIIMPFHMEKQSLAEIDRQIIPIKNEALKIEELKKETELLKSKIAAIEDFKHNNPMFLPILRELTIILPAKAWLTRVKINETTVEIEGYADTATNILPKLEASSYFRKTEFASATTRDPRKNVDRFAIKMEIRNDKKDEKEAVKSETKK